MTKSKRIGLAGLGGVFCLATFIMLIIFGKDSCTETYNGDTTDCESYDSYYEESSPESSSGYSIKCTALILEESSGSFSQKLTCAWSTGTEVLGYIGLAIAVIFFVVFVLIEAKRFFWMGGAAGALGLLICIILMIVDIFNGQKFYKDFVGTPPVSSWLVFAINALLAFLALIMIGISSLQAYYLGKKESPSGIGAGFRS